MFYFRLGQEIEKNSDLFAEIELIVRGVIPRDTKNNIPLFAQYFYYYSSLALVYSQENKAWEPPGIHYFTIFKIYFTQLVFGLLNKFFSNLWK